MDEAASTGAEALVTACSRCELNFSEAVAADIASGGPGDGLEVHDVLELVAVSAGLLPRPAAVTAAPPIAAEREAS